MPVDRQVQVRRIYDEPRASDGVRVLVDRLWPRGVSKERAHLDHWFKDIAPSTELREWYAHVPDRFGEFGVRYRIELQHADRSAALQSLRELSDRGRLTLLTATKNADISEAAVIADVLRDPGESLERVDPVLPVDT